MQIKTIPATSDLDHCMKPQRPAIVYNLQLICQKISEGYSESRIREMLREPPYQWSEHSIKRYVSQAYRMLTADAQQEIDNARAVQVRRIQDLLATAIEKNDKAVYLRLLDMLNRIYQLYVDRQEVKVTTNEIKFKFGDE